MIITAPTATEGRFLTEAEEREFVARAQAGDLAARNRLIEANLRYIWKRTIGFCRAHSRYRAEDLVGEAACGYIRAIERMDYAKAGRLSTLASWHIFAALSNFERANRSVIRVPCVTLYPGKTKKTPERNQRAADRAHSVISLDAGADDSDLAANLAVDNRESIYAGEELLQTQEALAAVAELPDRLRNVIEMRFFEGLTLVEAGERIGVTKERTRQLEAEAIHLLRRALCDPKPTKPLRCEPKPCDCKATAYPLAPAKDGSPRKRCKKCRRSWTVRQEVA